MLEHALFVLDVPKADQASHAALLRDVAVRGARFRPLT